MYAPGVWLQKHRLDLQYYDTLFKGLHRYPSEHQQRWDT